MLGLACIAAGFIAAHYKPLMFFPGPASIRIAISVVLFFIAVVGIFMSRRELVKHKEHPNPYRPTNAIVRSGIYSRTRNPIYVSFMFIVLASAVAANNGWLLLLTIKSRSCADSFAVPALIAVAHVPTVCGPESSETV